MATKEVIVNYLSILTKTPLFQGFQESEIHEFLQNIPWVIKTYPPSQAVVHQGDVLNQIGIILSGQAKGVKYGLAGQEIVVSRLAPASVFADVLSGANGFLSPVTVQAVTACQVLFIDYKRLLYTPHPAAHRILQNMIQNISLKYFAQNQRLDLLMIKGVRQKLFAFFSLHSQGGTCDCFEIGMNRQQLADYLGIERTALSRELSRMKQEKLIDYHKNKFIVYTAGKLS